MKFKMAPNSLFAVLLRSPWWISIAIGGVLTLVALAWLPDNLRPAGAVSGLPFFVIGAMALKRQWNAPSARQVESFAQVAAALSWPAWRDALERAWQRDGFAVERLGDGPADLRISRAGRSTLVCARRWKAARVGAEPLLALRAAADAREDGSSCAYLALGELSPQAQRTAQAAGVEVLQLPALAQLLRGVLPLS